MKQGIILSLLALSGCATFTASDPDCLAYETRKLAEPEYHFVSNPKGFGGMMRARIVWVQYEERVCTKYKGE